MKSKFFLSTLASLVACGVFAATSAHADIAPASGLPSTIDLKYSDTPFGVKTFEQVISRHETVTYQAGGISFGSASPAAGSFASYCVELSQFVAGGWNTYTLGEFSAKVGSGLARLYQVAGGSPTSALGSSAFQAAVWEIVNETRSTYSLDRGSFQGSLSSDSATRQANRWLTAVNNFNGPELYKAQKYASAVSQDLLVVTAVPEPETYAMLLAGLGLMGAVARRRQPV